MRSSLLKQLQLYAIENSDVDHRSLDVERILSQIADQLLIELDTAIPVFGVEAPVGNISLAHWPKSGAYVWHPAPDAIEDEALPPITSKDFALASCNCGEQACLLIRNTPDKVWFLLIVRIALENPKVSVPGRIAFEGAWASVVVVRKDGHIEQSAHGRFQGSTTQLRPPQASLAATFLNQDPDMVSESGEQRIGATLDFQEVLLPGYTRVITLTALQALILRTLWHSRGTRIQGEKLMGLCGSHLLKPVDAFKKTAYPGANQVYKALVRSNRHGYWITTDTPLRFL